MNDPILESGMRFDHTDVWRIEKSPLYTSLNKGDAGLKVVEFIRAKNGNYVFVEARSSFPKLSHPDSKENIIENISKIISKFIHSISMLSSVILRVNEVEPELPLAFSQLRKPSIQFVLVLNFPDGTEAICEEIRTRFEAHFPKDFMRIWKAKFWVMNKRQAIRWGIVLPDSAVE